MKEFFKKLWEKIKAWWNKTAKPWLKKSWMQIVNILVMFMAYGRFSNIEGEAGMETITGLWLFLLLAYYIFWKLFGAEHIFDKREKKIYPQPVPYDPTPVEPVKPPMDEKLPDPISEDTQEVIVPKSAAPKKKAPAAKKKPVAKKK